MNEKERLSHLIAQNNISEEQFYKLAHLTMINGLFETICKDIVKSNTVQEERSRFTSMKDKQAATKSILRRRYPNLILPEEDVRYLSIVFNAFFNRSPRKEIGSDKKKHLLQKQDYLCAICGESISANNAEADHILAYSFVGDNLEDNYQMICKTCNTRKGDSSSYQFSVLLTRKESKKTN